MSFEQYQFTRYYLPGSLFLVYLALFLAPFVNYEHLKLLLGNDYLGIIGLVGGAFVVSPALGYLFYTAYDSWRYNKVAIDFKNRPALCYLIKWVAVDGALARTLIQAVKDGTLRASLKSLMDFIIHSKPRGEEFEISDEQISGNLRGYWSHFNARYVCGFFVPPLALLSAVAIRVVYPLVSHQSLFTLPEGEPISPWPWFAIDFVFILVFTSFLLGRRRNPRNEAFELEHYVIATRTRGHGSYREARIHFLEVTREKICSNDRALLRLVNRRIREINRERQRNG